MYMQTEQSTVQYARMDAQQSAQQHWSVHVDEPSSALPKRKPDVLARLRLIGSNHALENETTPFSRHVVIQLSRHEY
jgi:hypothetical protein